MICKVLVIFFVNYFLFVCENYSLVLLEFCSKFVVIVCVMYNIFYFRDNFDRKNFEVVI